MRQATGWITGLPGHLDPADEQRLLLFSAGSFERLAVPLSLVSRLEEFPQSVIERAGGSQVVQYRGSLLALLSLASVLTSLYPATTVILAVTLLHEHTSRVQRVGLGLAAASIVLITI